VTADPTSPAPGGLAELFSPARRADPYPGYARLREAAAVWEAAPGFLVLSRHADCARVLRDSRFGHLEGEDAIAPRRRRVVLPGVASDEPVRSFLALNPPDHTRLRRLVSRSFTTSRVDELAPRIEAITRGLLSAVDTRRPFDAVGVLAAPLPVAVISELFGVPDQDRPRLVAWSHALARGLDPAFLVSEDERAAQLDARDEFGRYLSEQIDRRRREPGPDLVSDLVASRDRAESLTEPELIATCVLLLIAGHETTTSLIGNGLNALLANLDQFELLVAEPELVEVAVEELLRYDSPVQLTMRVALEDADAGGVPIAKGTFVLLLIGAANRDPLAYEDPDRLDILRKPTPHLAFGQGIHFCLGAPLARLEAQIALRALVQSFPGLHRADEPTWKENAVLRGVRRLEVDPGTTIAAVRS
jgi:cytochrome P450